MRIEKLVIKNFRSFDKDAIEVTFPDIQKPISIVGHNNSGKSNLINAILFGLNCKATNNEAFDHYDFYDCKTDNDFLVEVHITPPIKKATAFSSFTEITNFHLKVSGKSGAVISQHYCHGADGKAVFTVKATKKPKTKAFTPDEEEILQKQTRSGTETAYQNKDKVPIYYIDTLNIHSQLKATRYTLLGRIMAEVRKEFQSKDTTIKEKDGVYAKHVGQPNADVLEGMLRYIENEVIPTPKLEMLTEQIKEAIKKELEIESEHFELGFGLPPIEEFYKGLEFYVKEHENKPKLPISRFGNGFISLFVISMLKAIIGTDEGGKILVIEEPETFLHEHYQEYFYKLLDELAENNQVIYTTHSKKFINIFAPQTIVKVVTPTLSSSKVIHHPKATIEIPETIDEYKVRDVEDFAMYMRTLEPNMGNIIFARKVIIVEGPHDLLAYKTVLASKFNLGFHNISIVAAWGKDTLKSIIQICKLFEIEYFVIHDFDLANDCDITIPKKDAASAYPSLSANEKAQYTKNHDIATLAGIERVHHNKPNLESVLEITAKGSTSVYEKVSGKAVEDLMKTFPKFLPQSLLDFLER